MSNRNAEFAYQQHQKGIQRAIRGVDALDFFNALTGPELLEVTEAHLPDHRERLYPPTVTLSIFMGQALNSDGSCQQAVNGWAVRREAEGLSECSTRTGAYCKARQRLPVEMVQALTRTSGRMLSKRATPAWRWHGRTVKLVDGTGISMPDTPENQGVFPQLSTQAKGVGFPIARFVGVMCLATGAVIDGAIGPFCGKGNSELGLLRSLQGAFAAGDVLLGDALYCNYFVIATQMAAGVDVLFAQNGARITDFRRGESLGIRDHAVSWPKPITRPQWMSKEQYENLPDQITVREVKVGKRVLVTTLLDPQQVCKNELSELYAMRWHNELDLRHLKTTLGMDVLSCNTPQMCEKELWAHLLAYNVIRLLMAQAAFNARVHPRDISFKHTVQLWTQWISQRLTNNPPHNDLLFRLIAQSKVNNRPGRIEPRARKRRPKPYHWLKESRRRARHRVKTQGHGRKLK
ncbi:MAG: IS4 family transposase [Gemmatimonadales bacterium]